MIDNFSIMLSHGLLLLAFWLLTRRGDLDHEPPPEPDSVPQGFAAGRRRAETSRQAGRQAGKDVDGGAAPDA